MIETNLDSRFQASKVRRAARSTPPPVQEPKQPELQPEVLPAISRIPSHACSQCHKKIHGTAHVGLDGAPNRTVFYCERCEQFYWDK